MSRLPGRSSLAAVVALLFAASAQAGTADINLTQFRPASGGDGLAATEGARGPGDPNFDFKIWGVYESNPVVVGTTALDSRWLAWVTFSMRVTDGFSFFFQGPAVLKQNGTTGLGTPFYGQALVRGLGDAVVGFRYGLAQQARHGASVALKGSVFVPTARTGTLAGDEKVGFEGLLAFSHVSGDLKGANLELLINALVRYRAEHDLDVGKLGGIELGGRIGLNLIPGVPVLRRIFAELDASSTTRDSFTDPGSPIAVRGGLTLCFLQSVSLDAIVGGSLRSKALGSPEVQVIGALGWSPATCQGSDGGEAIRKAAAEAAAKLAAEKAAAEKAAADKLAAEKAAAEKAAADKLAAEKAAAAKAAAEKLAAEKAAAEKLAAEKQKAAEEAAAKVDTDGDGVPDRIDNCPTVKGVAANYGCPAADKQKVVVREGKIDILDKVQFAPGKATILKASFPLLDQVAKVLGGHPEILKVEVQGHTDSVGVPEKNMKLSQDRAQAVVDYLAKKAIAKDRMVAKGYGETTPIADNKTKKGQEQNRRVEFKVTEMKKAEVK